jgi:hypothetical protein
MVSQDNQLDGFTGYVLVVTGESPTKQTKCRGDGLKRNCCSFLSTPSLLVRRNPPFSSPEPPWPPASSRRSRSSARARWALLPPSSLVLLFERDLGRVRSLFAPQTRSQSGRSGSTSYGSWLNPAPHAPLPISSAEWRGEIPNRPLLGHGGGKLPGRIFRDDYGFSGL